MSDHRNTRPPLFAPLLWVLVLVGGLAFGVGVALLWAAVGG